MKSKDFMLFLFSNAEFPENMVEDVVGGDGAGEFAQMVERHAHVFGHEVGGHLLPQTVFSAIDGDADVVQ